jgi:hypothetical protein
VTEDQFWHVAEKLGPDAFYLSEDDNGLYLCQWNPKDRVCTFGLTFWCRMYGPLLIVLQANVKGHLFDLTFLLFVHLA